MSDPVGRNEYLDYLPAFFITDCVPQVIELQRRVVNALGPSVHQIKSGPLAYPGLEGVIGSRREKSGKPFETGPIDYPNFELDLEPVREVFKQLFEAARPGEPPLDVQRWIPILQGFELIPTTRVTQVLHHLRVVFYLPQEEKKHKLAELSARAGELRGEIRARKKRNRSKVYKASEERKIVANLQDHYIACLLYKAAEWAVYLDWDEEWPEQFRQSCLLSPDQALSALSFSVFDYAPLAFIPYAPWLVDTMILRPFLDWQIKYQNSGRDDDYDFTLPVRSLLVNRDRRLHRWRLKIRSRYGRLPSEDEQKWIEARETALGAISKGEPYRPDEISDFRVRCLRGVWRFSQPYLTARVQTRPSFAAVRDEIRAELSKSSSIWSIQTLLECELVLDAASFRWHITPDEDWEDARPAHAWRRAWCDLKYEEHRDHVKAGRPVNDSFRRAGGQSSRVVAYRSYR